MDHPGPIQPPNMPQRVNVVESASDRWAAKAFHRMLGETYRALRNELEENEDIVLEYYTPSGERIELNQVGYPPNSDMLIFQGYGEYGRLCQVLARASVLQMMFRIVTLSEGTESRPIGFEYKPPGV